MCGITGFYSVNGHQEQDARARLGEMTDTLRHRGPDEEGYYVDSHVALGHRRLSIIDLSSGQQPMVSQDGGYLISFNGEIYNYLEVRTELQQLGHRFLTKSDTETILLAYIQWGEACVERLFGMFAFAIWDKLKRQLFLARDRVGKKPLYYHWNGKEFFFASELKALRKVGGCPGVVDLQALDCYYSFGYIPSPRTIYLNTSKLEPAHTLLVSGNGLVKKRYWQVRFQPRQGLTLSEATEEFEALLDEATRCRLMSEVPLGAFLSGGLDSTLVVSSMAKAMASPVMTNSVGFGEKRFNELELARLVADHLRTNHTEYIMEPRAAEVLPRIAFHFDEPFADSSAVPTWYVCQMARQNVTVALSGDGGDESFGGYTFRYLPHIWECDLRARIPASVRSLLFAPLGRAWLGSARLPKLLRLKTYIENLAVGNAEAFYRDLINLRQDTREKIYTEDFKSGLRGFTPFEMLAPLYTDEKYIASVTGRDRALLREEALARAQFTDINFYMTEDVLVKVDRMSMAHALEVRSPLLDHRIIEFAANLPAHLKINGQRGKIVPRELSAQRLPKQILDLPKRGFSIPAAEWLRGELKDQAESAVFASRGIAADTLNRKVLARLWNEHQTRKRDHNVFLWGLMMLHLWERNHSNFSIPSEISGSK